MNSEEEPSEAHRRFRKAIIIFAVVEFIAIVIVLIYLVQTGRL